MSETVFAVPEPQIVPVEGQAAGYPIHRIFCVGRNYAAHAAELGNEVERDAPFYFTKSALAYAPTGAVMPYPPGTEDLHHEVEFVVALGAPVFRVAEADAMAAVWGYGVGLDMTRRDLQNVAKGKRLPWDLSKDFEQAAVLAPLTPAAEVGDFESRVIRLTVNGTVRQEAPLSDMVWTVPELIAHLSRYYHLGPGDLIMTGTPAGVAAVVAGDRLVGTVDGLAPVELEIGPAE